MATDVRLDQVDGSFLELDARVVKAISSDFMLDQPSRRKGGGPHRRALVHDQNDGLTVNFNGDYTGGVSVAGPIHLEEVFVAGPIHLELVIPKAGAMVVRGDIFYDVPGVDNTGHTTETTVSVRQEVDRLQSQISQLNAKVAALEAKK